MCWTKQKQVYFNNSCAINYRLLGSQTPNCEPVECKSIFEIENKNSFGVVRYKNDGTKPLKNNNYL